MANAGQLMVMARLGDGARSALQGALAQMQPPALPGELWSAPRNWHQSLSGWYPSSQRAALVAACNEWATRGRGFHLRLDQVRSRGRHVRLVPAGDDCPDLEALLRVGKSAFLAHGLPGPGRHTAHVTLCYDTERRWPTTRIEPVLCHVEAMELVEAAGQGATYHYRTVQRWALLPALGPVPLEQVDLFR